MSSSSQQDGYEPDIFGRHTLERRYEFVRELGRGGMAAVHLARERASGALVAVKAICARYANDQECLERFAREAGILANVEHPNIVRTLAVETVGGRPAAIVMEYMRGETLRQALRQRGPLSADRARTILRDVAQALEHAHARRVIHRDVKPENIFLDELTGRARLADFGIARPLEDDLELTISGMSLGTPAYMSPEQIDGAPLDRHSDIYSLGVVGWEMLTGIRPWDGETLYGVLYRQKYENLPPLSRLRPGLPPALRHAVEGALHKRTGARWGSAGEFLEALSGQRVAPSSKGGGELEVTLPDEVATLRFRRAAPAAIVLDDQTPDTAREEGVRTTAASTSWHRPDSHEPTSSDPFIPADPPWELPTLGESWEAKPPPFEQRRLASMLLAAAATILVATGLAERRSSDLAGARAEVVTVSLAGSIDSDRALPESAPAIRTGVNVSLRTRLDSLATCEIVTRFYQEVCFNMLVSAADSRVDRLFSEVVDAHRAQTGLGDTDPDPEELRRMRLAHRAWRLERDVECDTRHADVEGALWARDRARCATALAAERAGELTAVLQRARSRR